MNHSKLRCAQSVKISSDIVADMPPSLLNDGALKPSTWKGKWTASLARGLLTQALTPQRLVCPNFKAAAVTGLALSDR